MNEDRVRIYLSGMNSTKLSQRRNSATELVETFKSPSVVRWLNENHGIRGSISWDSILIALHQFIILEADKFQEDEIKKKSISTTETRMLIHYNEMIKTIVEKAEQQGIMFVTHSTLLTFIFQVLDNIKYHKYYLNSYLFILSRFLKSRNLRHALSDENWAELLRIMNGLFKAHNNSFMNRIDLTRAMKLLFKYSPGMFLRPWVDDLIIEWTTQETNQLHHKHENLKLTWKLCKRIAIDCRTAITKLGEAIIPKVLELYENRYEKKGGIKNCIFNFMLLQMEAHHPESAPKDSPLAFATSWSRWQHQINNIFDMVFKEIGCLLKYEACGLSPTSDPLVWENLLQLTVQVVEQKMNNTQSDPLHPSVKRARPTDAFDNLLDEIIPGSAAPWLQILNAFLRKYPQRLTISRIAMILTNLLELKFSDQRERLAVLECFTILLEAENGITNHNKLELACTWTRVWEFAIRSLGDIESEAQCNELIRTFIHCKKFDDASPLLRVLNSQTLNVDRLLTLSSLYHQDTEIFAENMINRGLLWNWILTDHQSHDKSKTIICRSQTTAMFLARLNLKEFPAIAMNKQTANLLESKWSKSYVEINFGTNFVNHSKNTSSDENFRVDLKYQQECDSYMKTFACTIKDSRYEPSLESFMRIIDNLIFTMNLASEYLRMKIVTEICDFTLTPTIILLVKMLEMNLNYLVDEAPTRKEINTLVNVLQQIEILFRINGHENVHTLLRENVSLSFLKRIMEVQVDFRTDEMDSMISENDSDCADDVLNTDTVPKKDKLLYQTFKTCTAFCCAHNLTRFPTTCLVILKELADNIMKEKNKDKLQMKLIFCREVVNCKTDIIIDNYVATVLNIVNNVYYAAKSTSSIVMHILHLIQDIIPKFQLCPDRTWQKSLLRLIKKINENNRHDTRICCIISQCVVILFKYDPMCTWSLDDPLLSSITLLTDALGSSYQEIRSSGLQALLDIFNANMIPGSAKQTLLKSIASKITTIFAIEDRIISETTKNDEIICRYFTVLRFYALAVWRYPQIRSHYLFLILKSMKSIFCAQDLVAKVLNMLVQTLQEKSISSLLNPYLEDILIKWITAKKNLKNFPYQATEHQTEMEFYSAHIQKFIVVLVSNGYINELDRISNIISKDKTTLIENNFAGVYGRVLPFILCDQNNLKYLDHSTVLEMRNAHRFLEEILPLQRLIELLRINIVEVIINITKLLDAESYAEELLKISVDIFEKPKFGLQYKTIMETFKQLEVQLEIRTDLKEYFAIRRPSFIEQILRKLLNNISQYKNENNALQATIRYICICEWMCLSFESEALEDLLVFIMRHIIFALVNLVLYNTFDEVQNAAIKYLRIFCEHCILLKPDIFSLFINNIIHLLVPVAKCKNKISYHVLELFTFLIIEHENEYSEWIARLEPFPNTTAFNEIRQVYYRNKYRNGEHSLEEEIKQFLEMNKHGKRSRIEGLQQLHNLLADKKDALNKLYKQLNDNRGFLEDCAKSVLHQLIYVLMQISSSNIKELSSEAAKCLGEIGPTSLTTTVLRIEPRIFPDAYKRHNMFVLTAGFILKLLCDLATDHVPDVQSRVGELFYELLGTCDGISALDDTIEYEDGPLSPMFFSPFIAKKPPVGSPILVISNNEFDKLVANKEIWLPKDSTIETYRSWLVNLLAAIVNIFTEPNYLKKSIPLCYLKLEFAEKIFPFIIEMFMSQCPDTDKTEKLSKCIANFFEKFWNGASIHIAAIKAMLNLVYFNKFRINTRANKQYIKVNYLHVAKAAQHCSDYFTCVFFAEMWCRDRAARVSSQKSSGNILELACSENIANEIVQDILRQAYAVIGDVDGIHGCGTSHLLNMRERIVHYEQMSYWQPALLHHDLTMLHTHLSPISTAQERPESAPLIRALKLSGLYHMASSYTYNAGDYECAWRMQNWSMPTPKRSAEHVSPDDAFHKNIYLALKSIREQELPNHLLENARQCVLLSLPDSLELTNTLYSALSKFQIVQDIYDFANDSQFGRNEQHLKVLFTKWEQQVQPGVIDFQYIEPVLAQRVNLLNIATENNSNDFLEQSLIDMQIKLSEMAREHSWLQVAKKALYNVSQRPSLSTSFKHRIQLEEAHLEYNIDKTVGRHVLKNLLQSLKDNSNGLKAKVLQLYGTWMLENRSENPQQYFTESLSILDALCLRDTQNIQNRISAYDSLARFADAEYQQVNGYIQSPAYEIKMKCMETATNVMEEFSKTQKSRSNQPLTKDEMRAARTNEAQLKIDKAEIENIKNDLDSYLVLAVKNYLNSFIEGETNDLRIFRVVSLWLDNKSNIGLNDLLTKELPKIPSHKFLPALPQIVPHINLQTQDSFVLQINQIIERCATDHPHHALPIILSLANMTKGSAGAPKQTVEPRVAQAQLILKKLSKHAVVGGIVRQMVRVSDALIQLAYLPIEKNGKIPDKLCKLKEISQVQIHTVHLPVEVSGKYDRIIGIQRWDSKYTTVGGINAPKKLWCLGTDGIKRPQLIKGEDDLRQDAVMQQVFSIMNMLLVASKNRHLLIRTYKVVPLSQKSGILEWCTNTKPILEYLANKNEAGAHERYYPNDATVRECQQKLKDARPKNNETKLKVFLDICSKFRPAFHHFFLEEFEGTALWWERRRAYTLSVAVTSMVGYILGIGDRHLNNILIDCSTAEIIHIDFGIAFEQGKILPTPETIPFRLTRDIEDGMGISGVEGVFRRSCEKTLRVLRENSEIILTILQVLLYDPLHLWNVSASKAMKVQREQRSITGIQEECNNGGTVQVNKMAERALLRLSQKLYGTEEGRVSSIDGQVERLIQQARDPANLCRLFYGWGPFL